MSAKSLLFMLILALAALAAAADPAAEALRYPPDWSFSVAPTSLGDSYWDYFSAGYNDLPLCVIPPTQGGGYFLTWQGKADPSAHRRIHYAYLDPMGNIINNSVITNTNGEEGYPALAVDPVSGKPFYAWHANIDADDDFEVLLASDAFIAGIAGLFTVTVLIDNPVSITTPNGTTTDNQFIWPSLAIGPSPVAGKRRLYALARNAAMHNGSTLANVYFGRADFDASDIENATALDWTWTSISELDTGNVTPGQPRLNLALAADAGGSVYCAGNRYQSGITDTDLEVFACPLYGEGDWTHISFNSNLPSWNPPATPTGTIGYFTDDDNVPYPNNELVWRVTNSSHLNAVADNYGNLHLPGLWALNNPEGYYPNLHFVKEAVWRPDLQQFQIREIHRKADPSDYVNVYYQPWDNEQPWGVVDGWGGNPDDGFYPLMGLDWPFPYWDETAHQNAMTTHYNNVKLTRPNPHGQMAAVWVDSWRARQYHGTQNPAYAAYADTPEIYISYSPNNGGYWYSPIVLNNVDTPQLAGIKPLWVYPADQMIYTGYNNGILGGKLGLLLYNDYTWGCNSIPNPVHPNPDGGEMMFTEININLLVAADDPAQAPPLSLSLQNWPNPFNPSTTISFELPRAGEAELNIFDVKGRLVRNLISQSLPAGKHSQAWYGTDDAGQTVASGIYFCRIEALGRVENLRMALLK